MLFFNRKPQKKNVILYGSPRSGTTWVAEVIANAGLKLIFEPMHPTLGLELKEKIPEEFLTRDDKSEYEKLYKKAIGGKILNKWSVRQNRDAKRYVVKLVNANLLIDWIEKNFDFYSLFIIRNPLSVVASAKREGWWDDLTDINKAIKINKKLLDFLGKYSEEIYKAKSFIEIFTVMWCIENKVPQIQGYFEKLTFVKYKDLVTNPLENYKNIFKLFEIPEYEGLEESINKRSIVSNKAAEKKDYNFETEWKNLLTKEEIETVEKIVTAFELESFL